MAATVLVVDDEETARMVVSEFLRSKGYEVLEAGTLADARAVISKGVADIIILDVRLPDGYGPHLLTETSRLPMRPQVIIITAHGEVSIAVEAMKNGAQDFMEKPLDLLELEKSVNRAAEVVLMRRELAHLRSDKGNLDEFIVGSTPQMKHILELAGRASESSVSVLITGPTGTGKEVLAKYIHRIGPRSGKPFIDINCPAIQPTMFESELFGHEAGSFTGATSRRNGLMEIADGGILFLDEISSMPVDLQAKFLRALEERAFRRVGGTNLIRVDVQVIAASNRDLEEMIARHEFREDLYYRLKVVDLDLPSLAERRQDIPDLVGYMVRKFNKRLGANILDVSPAAMQALISYDWPGNIRELSNAIERAVLFCDEPTIDLNHLPKDVTK
ncbi:MAG: sigma-54-dependent Fis family transcriptional regulator [Anaerolineaceae bacterium]|jgi:DNA-binding NtrC family response regulator|nr:sigma-54-dependent Fis family transcriptional regulator [Anaerolineaceae bacterium]MDI9531285.1 sigma-54 dependent transcriptional regulator [Chloroflexota bacterium]HNZ16220.1 sigma-54 dependent transcriptional regulator [Anaerolineaceae bacterium]